MFYAADSLVRTYRKEDDVQGSRKGRGAGCGMNTQELSGKSALVTSSSKMSGACSPAELRSSYRTWPRSGTMQNRKCSPQPPLVPRTIVKGCSLLPTPIVSGLTEGLGFLLRSNESWASTSNLSAYLIGLEYGLTGREKRPHGKHIADPSFIEWMMGAPKGWTGPAA